MVEVSDKHLRMISNALHFFLVFWQSVCVTDRLLFLLRVLQLRVMMIDRNKKRLICNIKNKFVQV